MKIQGVIQGFRKGPNDPREAHSRKSGALHPAPPHVPRSPLPCTGQEGITYNGRDHTATNPESSEGNPAHAHKSAPAILPSQGALICCQGKSMKSGFAAMTQRLAGAEQEFRIIPDGLFRANDGRPLGLPGWKMDSSIASMITADLATRDELVIDYEHQTLLAKQNGQPAPAAGWFSSAVWREGKGLFAVGVKWTDRAKRMITALEYRYISPVFTYDEQTGRVERLLALGLTNNPGLSNLTDLSLLAATAVRSGSAQRPAYADGAQGLAKAAAAYQTQQAALGRYVTTVQAVGHVSGS